MHGSIDFNDIIARNGTSLSTLYTFVIWQCDDNKGMVKDTLENVPQRVYIDNIPCIMWEDEALNKIATPKGIRFSTLWKQHPNSNSSSHTPSIVHT